MTASHVGGDASDRWRVDDDDVSRRRARARRGRGDVRGEDVRDGDGWGDVSRTRGGGGAMVVVERDGERCEGDGDARGDERCVL